MKTFKEFGKTYLVTGEPFKVPYYMIGGSYQVPYVELDDNNISTGINSSKGFETMTEAINFIEKG